MKTRLIHFAPPLIFLSKLLNGAPLLGRKFAGQPGKLSTPVETLPGNPGDFLPQ
ncbi:MAG TPA: hypothetical protein VLQ91_10945 [Draconibacterium sp.]|nr:hypothetical protein [Draconibacterium sp.]